MSITGRVRRRRRAAVGSLILGIGLSALPAAAVLAVARPAVARPAVAAAIDHLRLERDLVEQARQLPPPIPRDLHDQIRSADEAGVRSLAALIAEGLAPSANLLATLGPLPVPSGPTPPRLPPRGAYDSAIRELGGDPGPGGAPAPPDAAAPAVRSAPAIRTATTATVALVVSVAALIGLVLVVLSLLLRRRKDKRLISEAMTDSLTGLFNRRRLDNDLLSLSAKKAPVGVLMVDVDNFKSFNDARGHSAGDRVLQQVGLALSQQVRIKDVVYRYGGEEFCILLPNAAQSDAMIVAERIRAATSRLEIGDAASVTVSVGVAIGSGTDVMTTLDRADAALYDAKRDGRDRVSLAA